AVIDALGGMGAGAAAGTALPTAATTAASSAAPAGMLAGHAAWVAAKGVSSIVVGVISGVTILGQGNPNLPTPAVPARSPTPGQAPTGSAKAQSLGRVGPLSTDPLNERSRFAGVDYAINRSLKGPIAERDHDRAAKAALRFWQVTGIETFYAPELMDDADTLFNPATGAIVVRFGRGSTETARVFLSSAYHEGVHVQQARTGNWAHSGITPANAVNELEAYTLELR